MRTTVLVCLAASLSMIQANLLMNSVGKAQNSFVVLDLMRLPLGILSGMGFIGAGTILRKGDIAIGVTTAATLWFATMMGLCFGGGQLGLGIAALALGFGTLWGLRFLEGVMRQDDHADLILFLHGNTPTEEEIRQTILRGGGTIMTWGVAYADHGRRREIRTRIKWRALPGRTQPPAFVSQFVQNEHIEKIRWEPQGTTREITVEDSFPKSGPGAVQTPG
jgi:putative Mg2+ transporter-C (MgtC) family protein